MLSAACVLLQAAANAKNNNGAAKSKLYVAEAFADQGPILKRFRCRAQGR
jgi:large subunit ribosomal protein L22